MNGELYVAIFLRNSGLDNVSSVAMTRARRHLCVVGDSSTVVHGGAYLKKWIGWLEANADIRFPDV